LVDYHEFSGIRYIKQNDFNTSCEFKIALCSMQFFKTKNKKELIDIDMIISDEAHIGASTEMSKSKIFNSPCVKTIIFASGTPGRTPENFHVKPQCIYKWGYMDNMLMKSKNYNTFSSGFRTLIKNQAFSSDYSHYPTNVYLKGNFSATEKILDYNQKHGKNLGISWQAIFALDQNGELELASFPDGKELLCSFLSTIISSDRNSPSILKRIINIQRLHSSRTENKLIIIFLPVHIRDVQIAPLQKALKKFIEDNNLWPKYSVIYNNASESHTDKNWINGEIEKSERGCVLLLGEKSTVGVTYNSCDATIHLDNTTSIDNHKQKLSRSGTDAPGKTVFITVDMNFQRNFKRYYRFAFEMAREAKDKFKLPTLKETLIHLHTNNIFLMDPDEIQKSSEIEDHYKNIMQEVWKTNEEKDLLDSINISDELTMLSGQYKVDLVKEIKELCGENQDLPTGEAEKEKVEKNIQEYERNQEEIIETINKTQVLFRTFLIPLVSLFSRKYGVEDAMEHAEASEKIIEILCEKDSGLKKSHDTRISWTWFTMKKNNQEIVEKIHEIYLDADPDTLRQRIAEHFIPTEEEKKGQAEIPTPVKLVDEMLDKIPEDFWTTPKKVLEPCCGKGNFVLGIYDRFFKGLEKMFPDKEERHQVIVEECLWFCDISPLNVFITSELLRCHSYGYESPNTSVGDTLQKSWDFQFDAVIGNPPYTTSQEKNSRNSTPLYNLFCDKFIDLCDKLVFVIPSRWFITGKGLERFRKNIQKRKDIECITHVDKSDEWFGNNVDIKGGCCILYKNSKYNGLCKFNGEIYDLNSTDKILNPKYIKIINTFKHFKSLNECFVGRHFKIETNDSILNNNGNICCYVSKKQSSNRIKFINYNLTDNNKFWKVISPTAVKGAYSGFNELFILNEYEIHNDSYVSFKVHNKDEAQSLLSYLKTTLVNKLLSIRKISQTISKDTIKYIPFVPLDRIWTDKNVYEYFNLSKEEIKLIENTIQ